MSTSTLESPANSESRPEPDPVAAAQAVADDLPETCSHCHSTEPFGDSAWCPRCGYHPQFDMVFDVDSGDWEQPATALTDAIPPWLVAFAVGHLGIFCLGFFARLSFGMTERAMWTLGQVLFGIVAFCIGHIAAYTHAAAESDKFGPFDMFFQPAAVWKPTTTQLPRNAWRVWLAGWGLCAILVALVVVGGIDWMGIFDKDWGVKKGAQGNLISAVADQARREQGGGESLEDSLRDLDKDEKKLVEKMMKQKADCLVFGCFRDPQGKVSTLLLASVYKRRLRFVGRASMVALPPEVQEELTRVIPLLERDTPFVETTVAGATWLHPVKLLRFEIDGWTRGGQLKNPVFDALLEDVRLP